MDETCRERKMDIPVDGLVICYDDTDYAASGSVTGHHATRAGFAFKWQDEAVDTKLKYIEWSCAVSTISPVAVFEPVQIEEQRYREHLYAISARSSVWESEKSVHFP